MIVPRIVWHHIALGVGILSALILFINEDGLITVSWKATHGPQTRASVEF
jgi:hypothetical protein